MLIEIDRLQLASNDPKTAIDRWQTLLGAKQAGHDRIRCLGAQWKTFRVGRSVVEILSADGSGLVE